MSPGTPAVLAVVLQVVLLCELWGIVSGAFLVRASTCPDFYLQTTLTLFFTLLPTNLIANVINCIDKGIFSYVFEDLFEEQRKKEILSAGLLFRWF